MIFRPPLKAALKRYPGQTEKVSYVLSWTTLPPYSIVCLTTNKRRKRERRKSMGKRQPLRRTTRRLFKRSNKRLKFVEEKVASTMKKSRRNQTRERKQQRGRGSRKNNTKKRKDKLERTPGRLEETKAD